MWRIESFELLFGKVGEVQITGGNKVAGEDAHLAPTLARPPALVTRYLTVLAQHLNLVPLGQAQLVLAWVRIPYRTVPIISLNWSATVFFIYRS